MLPFAPSPSVIPAASKTAEGTTLSTHGISAFDVPWNGQSDKVQGTKGVPVELVFKKLGRPISFYNPEYSTGIPSIAFASQCETRTISDLGSGGKSANIEITIKL